MTKFRVYDLMLDCRKMGHKVTQKDLAEAAGIGQTAIHKIIHGRTKSPSTQVLLALADYFTKALGQKITIDDLIEKPGDSPGQAAVTPNRPSALPSWMQTGDTESVTNEDFIAIPILGDIPCGDLERVSQGDIVGYQHVHKNRVGKGRFFLRAKGDSMETLIVEGDLLLVEPGNHWNNNTVVAVYIDGQVTCKRLQLYDHSAALVSDNRKYPPLIITDEMIIIGRVIKIERNLVDGWQP